MQGVPPYMSHRKSILLLVVLLLMMATLGSVPHHHQNSTSEQTCQICPLNHQPIEYVVVSNRELVLIPVNAQPKLDDREFPPSPLVRRLPVRAPPTA
jgi:hypothetical protein